MADELKNLNQEWQARELERVLNSSAHISKKAKELLRFLRPLPGAFFDPGTQPIAHECMQWLEQHRYAHSNTALFQRPIYELAPAGRKFDDNWILMNQVEDDSDSIGPPAP